jgi:hypothetical protein
MSSATRARDPRSGRGRTKGSWITVSVVGAAAVLALLVAPGSPAGSDEARGQPSGAAAASILGAWKLNCENADGMVVDLSAPRAGEAVGRVKVLGLGRRFHYKVGDEILRLKASGAAWTGQLHWRNQTGTQRWQPITMRLVNGKLHGTTEAEYCYENMERAR